MIRSESHEGQQVEVLKESIESERERQTDRQTIGGSDNGGRERVCVCEAKRASREGMRI